MASARGKHDGLRRAGDKSGVGVRDICAQAGRAAFAKPGHEGAAILVSHQFAPRTLQFDARYRRFTRIGAAIGIGIDERQQTGAATVCRSGRG